MKKLVILLMVLFLTGCTVVRIDTSSIDNIINVVLSKDNDLYNRVGRGYKYYVPRGVTYLDTSQNNDILFSNGNRYYLYIDIISYYHNVEREYIVNNGAYYSRAIDINGKRGYLEINRQSNGRYFIEFMYNFAKIEALVEHRHINSVILDASYILSTIKFNSNVISLMLDDDFLNIEEKFDIFTPRQETEDFIKREEEGEIDEYNG